MAQVIQVTFHKQQGPDELYRSLGVPKRLFIRQMTQEEDRVVWASASKWKEGYEANAPLKAGVTVKVFSGPRKLRTEHFAEVMEADESGFVSAEKKDLFMSEHLQNAAKEYANKLSLKPYDSWAKWLMSETTRYDYVGYADNWLHFGTNVLETETVGSIEIFGCPFSVERTKWQHMVCGKVWDVFEIKDALGNVAELCGIRY